MNFDPPGAAPHRGCLEVAVLSLLYRLPRSPSAGHPTGGLPWNGWIPEPRTITPETQSIIPVPLEVINAVKAAGLAGKQDIEIIDLLEACACTGHRGTDSLTRTRIYAGTQLL